MSDDTPKTVDELLDTLDLTDKEKAVRQCLIETRDASLLWLRLDALMAEIELDRNHTDALFNLAKAVRDRLIAARGNGSENAEPPWELVVPTNMNWPVSMTKGESEGGGE